MRLCDKCIRATSKSLRSLRIRHLYSGLSSSKFAKVFWPFHLAINKTVAKKACLGCPGDPRCFSHASSFPASEPRLPPKGHPSVPLHQRIRQLPGRGYIDRFGNFGRQDPEGLHVCELQNYMGRRRRYPEVEKCDFYQLMGYFQQQPWLRLPRRCDSHC